MPGCATVRPLDGVDAGGRGARACSAGRIYVLKRNRPPPLFAWQKVNELPDAARLRAITGSPFKVKKGTEMLVIGFTDGEEGTVNVVYNG